jgi:diaminopimelate decarboxylase
VPGDELLDPRADPATGRMLVAFGCADADELRIGGLSARALADRFGTPLYVFDGGLLDARARAVREALGPRVQVLWSVKANPSLAVCARLRQVGLGAEVASLGELELALAAGHAAAGLRFAGPGKTDAEIAAAVAHGLGCFHAESASEVDAIGAAARAAGRRVGVAVRVNPPGEATGARLRMAGAGARFGVDQEQVPALLQRIAGDSRLELRGLHVYAGTQCFDARAFVDQARALATLADGWERELDLRLPELDLGGGFGAFGAPAYVGDPGFDLAAAAAGVRATVADHDRRDRSWFVELGRYLVAEAGVYLARVVRSKTSAGRQQVALDGGLHHCALAAGAGLVLRRPPLLVHATALRQQARTPVAVGGPLCTPQDQFGAAVLLPPCREGDLLAVLGVGAYGLSYSPTMFLSHPTPAEVLAQGGTARVVRARGSATDVLRGQQP